jgi:hypothetical protein
MAAESESRKLSRELKSVRKRSGRGNDKSSGQLSGNSVPTDDRRASRPEKRLVEMEEMVAELQRRCEALEGQSRWGRGLDRGLEERAEDAVFFWRTKITAVMQ